MWQTIQEVIGFVSGLLGIASALVASVAYLRHRIRKRTPPDQVEYEGQTPAGPSKTIKGRKAALEPSEAGEDAAAGKRKRARARVRPGATGILIVGGAALLLDLIAVAKALIVPLPQIGTEEPISPVALGVVILGCLLASAVAIFGATQMLRLRNYVLSVAACFSVMFAGGLLCLPFGAVVGIWSLMALTSPEVSSVFD